MRVEKATKIGFCFGVKRAIEMLEKVCQKHDRVEALGAIVHNQQVLQRLADIGVKTVGSLDDTKGDIVAITTHGVSPQLESEMRNRYREIINTTCPFVHRAQRAAGRLSRAGFFVTIYGDVDHPEVKGILGWANGKGIATLDENFITCQEPIPRRLGILSQTTQIPACFTEFARRLVDPILIKDSEIRIIDTICHDIRERQQATLELARRVDVMLVVGSHTSANTNHLASLCSSATRTYLIESADEIQTEWFQDSYRVGITGGASTGEQTIDEVLMKLKTEKTN
ncbi:MAG: 4-hydroxy-3-methylbut-2-enyl diphosphate reductase [Dehalococcoidales bacterium]|nr:4-hydroxy-3-methylbut-2-enyl diphosphate reductase [Dehalococcoidales bacterium]